MCKKTLKIDTQQLLKIRSLAFICNAISSIWLLSWDKEYILYTSRCVYICLLSLQSCKDMKELTTQMYTQHVCFKHHITLYEWAKHKRGETRIKIHAVKKEREGKKPLKEATPDLGLRSDLLAGMCYPHINSTLMWGLWCTSHFWLGFVHTVLQQVPKTRNGVPKTQHKSLQARERAENNIPGKSCSYMHTAVSRRALMCVLWERWLWLGRHICYLNCLK